VMMTSLNEPDRQALGCIEDGLACSDPRLASMLNIFSRLAAGEEMPAGEKIRVRRGRPAAHCPRHAQRRPRRGTALPQARRLYQRLGQQQAMLVLLRVTPHAGGNPCRSPKPGHQGRAGPQPLGQQPREYDMTISSGWVPSCGARDWGAG
jgi:hypothetical protein